VAARRRRLASRDPAREERDGDELRWNHINEWSSRNASQRMQVIEEVILRAYISEQAYLDT
jgi:hypothetical protein